MELTFVKREKLIAAIFMIAVVLSLWPVIKICFPLDININSLSVFLIPVIIYVKDSKLRPIRFGVFSGIVFLFYALSGLPILLFISGGFFMLFLLEIFFGKLNNLAFSVVVIIAPVTVYLFNIAGFYIRLILTELAANILVITGHNCSTQGNLIFLNNESFTVEAECMGLNMVRISLLFCLFFIAVNERKSKIEMSWKGIFLMLNITFLLVMLGNLFRILIIVKFRIFPESPYHELAGIFCLTGTIILPLSLLAKKMVQIFSSPIKTTLSQHSKCPPKFFYPCAITTVLVFFFLCYVRPVEKAERKAQVVQTAFSGYKLSEEKFGVLRFQSDASIVYVKAPIQFYRTDHHPLICWKASGYTIKSEAKHIIGKKLVGYAELVKDNEVLYSYWWYDNGGKKSMSELEWRLDNLMGSKDYSLINVASKHPLLLNEEAEKFLNSKILN